MSNCLLITSRTLFQQKLSNHPRVKALIKKSVEASENVSSKTTKDDKPWPKSLRIAGYTGAALAIPLTAFTLLTEFPSLRDRVSGNDERPHDPDYHAFGKRLLSFVEKYWTSSGSFDNERFSSQQKLSNLEIARMMDNDVAVELLVVDNQPINFKLPANIPLDVKPAGIFTQSRLWLDGICHGERNQSLSEDGSDNEGSHLASWMRLVARNEGPNRFAIEFPDQQQNLMSEDLSQSFISYSDDGAGELNEALENDVAVLGEETTEESSYARHLLSVTHSFSTWHTHDEPSPDATTEKKKSGSNSESSLRDIRISELEWREAQIQADLIDPFCTKDIDEMQAELYSIKRELRSLKRWKWASSLFGRRKQ